MPGVDFTEVEVAEFDPIPRGRYAVRVVEVEEREGQESGLAYFNMQYEVIEGDHEGRKVFDNLSFSPKALWRLKGFLLAAGYTEEELAGELSIEADELIEVEIEVQVVIKNDQEGTPRNNISRFYAVVD